MSEVYACDWCGRRGLPGQPSRARPAGEWVVMIPRVSDGEILCAYIVGGEIVDGCMVVAATEMRVTGA